MNSNLPAKPKAKSRLPAKRERSTLAKRTRKHTISRKVKAALDLMVWLGLKRDEAALKAGLKDNSLYVALRKPDVKAYYAAECEVLRVSGRAQRIHRLEKLAEQDENKQAAVNAIRSLELMGDDPIAIAGHVHQVPGFSIVVVARETEAPANPLARGPSIRVIEQVPSTDDRRCDD